jgi:hypothetical protein
MVRTVRERERRRVSERAREKREGDKAGREKEKEGEEARERECCVAFEYHLHAYWC